MAGHEEIDKHVLKKYEIQQKLGKGVSPSACASPRPRKARAAPRRANSAPARP
jgi:hypothetical protein